MLFTSISFLLLYLPVVFFGFFAIARFNHRLAAFWLGAASVFFYGYWNPAFVGLLLVSIAFNYAAGYAIGYLRANNDHRSALTLTAAIATNLALLTYYKYANFFLNSASALAKLELPLLDVVLPLGISFFTFTQIAFLIDVRRGIAKESNFTHYLLFVTYFPHLIAGPILRHRQMIPQFVRRDVYQPAIDRVAVGLLIFSIGMAKKVLLADSFAEYATPIFEGTKTGIEPSFIVAWAGALAFTLQIYFDFSGYSDMAIGLSRLFGVNIPLNFNSPYKANNIIDFWRRWHITLSDFLRDYLYIPLGGNRFGAFRRYINLMVTMLLGGLWHGANWTFVIWGGLHGLYLVINHVWQSLTRAKRHEPKLLTRLAGGGLTFLAVVVAWVFFRAETLNSALLIVRAMSSPMFGHHPEFAVAFGPYAVPPDSYAYICWLLGLGLCIVWLAPNTHTFIGRLHFPKGGRTWFLVGVLIFAVLIMALINGSKGASEFIYFNF